jgi:hypothetical protein
MRDRERVSNVSETGSSAGFAGASFRTARLGRRGPSPATSCGSHCVLGEESEGAIWAPSDFLAAAVFLEASQSLPGQGSLF